MPYEDEIRVRRDAAMWRQVDGETIVLSLPSATYLGINSTGSLLWAAIVDGADRSALVRLLVRTFDADPARAGADVEQFIDACRARGLVE